MVALRSAPNLPDEGEKIAVIGNPLGLEGTVSDGIVSSDSGHSNGWPTAASNGAYLTRLEWRTSREYVGGCGCRATNA